MSVESRFFKELSLEEERPDQESLKARNAVEWASSVTFFVSKPGQVGDILRKKRVGIFNEVTGQFAVQYPSLTLPKDPDKAQKVVDAVNKFKKNSGIENSQITYTNIEVLGGSRRAAGKKTVGRARNGETPVTNPGRHQFLKKVLIVGGAAIPLAGCTVVDDINAFIETHIKGLNKETPIVAEEVKEPTHIPTKKVEPTKAPTLTPKPTEAPVVVRPSSGGLYSAEIWSAIESGQYKEAEEKWKSMLEYYTISDESEETRFARESVFTFKYLADQDDPTNLDNVLVALESSDYPNTLIVPPIDFEKSKGLEVYYLETLPELPDGEAISDDLLPRFLTIEAGEDAVGNTNGDIQERFVGTSLVNKGGELVRINAEGKIIAKIGVKPETKEAKWVRELCGDYSNPANYTEVTIKEIREGEINFDESVQAEPFPEDVVFPASFVLNVNEVGGSVFSYNASGEPYNRFYRNAFFYMLDETRTQHLEDGDKLWYMPIIAQQFLQKDGTWSFVKRVRGWSGEGPERFVEKLAPNMAWLPTFYSPELTSAYRDSLNYYRNINNDETLLKLDGNIQRLYEEYTVTGFIPEELTKYIIPGGTSFVKVK